MTHPTGDALMARIKELEDALECALDRMETAVQWKNEGFGQIPQMDAAIAYARKALNAD